MSRLTAESQTHSKLHSIYSLLMILITLLTMIISLNVMMHPSSLFLDLANLIQTFIPLTHLHLLAAAVASLISVGLYFIYRPIKHVYLIDFSCYRPPNHCRAPLSTYVEHLKVCSEFDEGSIEFQTKLLERSGLGNETCLPVATHQLPPDQSLPLAHHEFETVAFTIVQDLLTKQQISPTTIDILITNSGIFCPSPSISAILINRFGFRSNVRSFHLSGMGCSASLKSLSLASDLLKVHENSLVLIVSTETTNGEGYAGKVRSMLITNCLFRMGGVAILLSNRKRDRPASRYQLQHLVCKHLGSKDTSYGCINLESDKEGQVGVRLSKVILQVAGDALKANIRSLAPRVLPYMELLCYAWSRIRGPVYVPDFKKAFEHFCIHAGGKGVIDAIGEVLRLGEEDVEASRMTLWRFGNTSSSSIWYSLDYWEAKERVKKGDRVWQIAFGSGFKCNSAVWKCISDHGSGQNAWSDRIHRYPVEVSKVLNH